MPVDIYVTVRHYKIIWPSRTERGINMKIDITQTSSKAGGRNDDKQFHLEVGEQELAVMAKVSPLWEKFIVEFATKMADEQTRHNKAWEQLERDRFEHQKAQDEKSNYWQGEYEEARDEISELREKLREAESQLWDWQHGLKTKDDKSE